MKIYKTNTVGQVKQYIQKYVIKLWSRMLKGDNKLFVIDEIDIKAKYVIDMIDNSEIDKAN